jgi:hypothetical protein
MNLLIIGNGFDLNHGLKTNYDDFLQWAYKNGQMGIYDNFDLQEYWKNKISNKNYITHTPNFANTLFSKQGGTWLQLESNLAEVVSDFQAILGTDFNKHEERFYNQFKAIFNDLLIIKFERYIANVVNSAKTKQVLAVEHADLILSFNYSNTYERLYSSNKKVPICYINGKAIIDKHSPHIVLGCDYYSSKNIELSWYNKVFQRTNKANDSKQNRSYITWLKNNEKTKYKIYIVGHSLGKTDHDILKRFVLNENNETYVYFHSLESKYELIHNMIEMVGAEFMNSHNIDFLPISELNIHRSAYAANRAKPPAKIEIISKGINK